MSRKLIDRLKSKGLVCSTYDDDDDDDEDEDPVVKLLRSLGSNVFASSTIVDEWNCADTGRDGAISEVEFVEYVKSSFDRVSMPVLFNEVVTKDLFTVGVGVEKDRMSRHDFATLFALGINKEILSWRNDVVKLIDIDALDEEEEGIVEGGTQFLILSVHGIALPYCEGMNLTPDGEKFGEGAAHRDSTTCAAYSTCCQFVRLGKKNSISKSNSKMLRKSEMYVNLFLFLLFFF